MDIEEKPQSSLDLAQKVVAFARTLSDDPDLITEVLVIAREAVCSDQLALRRARQEFRSAG